MAQGPEEIFEPLFPTFLGVSTYPDQEKRKAELVDAVYALRERDAEGRQRSKSSSSIGYTSYYTQGISVRLMEQPPFDELAKFISARAFSYANFQHFDVGNYELVMSTFWVNVQPRNGYHAEHVHPYSHISGVFYLSTAPDAGDILLRDPRAGRVMSMPPIAQLGPQNSDVVTIAPSEGQLLLVPSWLVHGVQQNHTDHDRISLSFNFELQPRGARRAGG